MDIHHRKKLYGLSTLTRIDPLILRIMQQENSSSFGTARQASSDNMIQSENHELFHHVQPVPSLTLPVCGGVDSNFVTCERFPTSGTNEVISRLSQVLCVS